MPSERRGLRRGLPTSPGGAPSTNEETIAFVDDMVGGWLGGMYWSKGVCKGSRFVFCQYGRPVCRRYEALVAMESLLGSSSLGGRADQTNAGQRVGWDGEQGAGQI